MAPEAYEDFCAQVKYHKPPYPPDSEAYWRYYRNQWAERVYKLKLFYNDNWYPQEVRLQLATYEPYEPPSPLPSDSDDSDDDPYDPFTATSTEVFSTQDIADEQHISNYIQHFDHDDTHLDIDLLHNQTQQDSINP